MKLAFFTLAILFLVKYASSEELPVEKDPTKESKHRADHSSKEVSGDYNYEDYVEDSIEDFNGTKSHDTADEDNKSYEYAAETDPDAVSYEEEDFADDPGDRTLIAKGIQFTLFIDRFECQKNKAILILPSSLENMYMYP